MIKPLAIYALAALAEIAGCFAFWEYLRSDRQVWLLVPGIAALLLFAWLLTLVDLPDAGRAYAAYGGIYIVASLVWLMLVEGVMPNRWDLVGGTMALAGCCIILLGRNG
ncbi:YnfA family protein [Blastomonas sp.]|uniref:YnfA family protein n=1 Tax=Blastomonas sp. TaxID=1909299 RepID=UPI00359324B4